MRSFIHARFVECAIALAISAVWSVMGDQSSAQTVWSGLTYQFTKPDNQPAPFSQDKITPSVSFTRGVDRGLYNGILDGGWNGSGPSDTEWATQFNNPGKTIAATNYQNLDSFGTWLEAYGGGGVGFNIPGVNAVVHLITDDIYLDLRFTHWQTSGGGGFAYVRAAPPPNNGDYNGDLAVNAADYTVWRNTLGTNVLQSSGADGNNNGMIDDGDYAFWKSRYGEFAGAAGASQGVFSEIPEPTTLVLALAVLFTFPVCFVRRNVRRAP